MIRVWEFTEPVWGLAFKRISKAFRDYSPDYIEWVETPRHADISIIHVLGELPRWVLELKNKVMIQHVVSTMHQSGNTNWIEEWKKSLLTVSFHPLNEYYTEQFSFYHMPWGADPKTFYIRKPEFNRDFKVITTGHIAVTENIDKLYQACKQINTFMIHTGENFAYDSRYYKYLNYMKDSDLADVLCSTEYVSCLRQHEGFEMLGVEGLFCGTRPIVFDLPTYQWYKGHGIFIKQDDNIVESLVKVLSEKPKAVDEDEYKEIISKFSWPILVENMFKRIKKEYDERGI